MLMRPLMFRGAAVVAGSTWNPADKAPGITLSNGNLTATYSSGSTRGVRATKYLSAGDIYYQVTCNNSGGEIDIGFANNSFDPTSAYLGANANGISYVPTANAIYYNGNAVVSGLPGAVSGDVIGCRYNFSSKNFTVYMNGSSVGSSTAFSATSAAAAVSLFNATVTANFGQSAFTGGVPSGSTAYG